MKLSRHKRQNSIVMNMTPMIDIVFLLLIFFMMVSQVSEVRKNREIELTKTEEKGTDEQKPSKITVNIDQHGEITVLRETLSVAELVIKVSDELYALDNQLDRLTIVVRVDRRAKCRIVNEIVKQFNSLGVKKVRFSLETSEG